MSETPPPADVARLLEHRAWVRALAGRLLRDPNAVDDVEQDTWAAALRSGPSEPRALRSWLGSVASRFALQRLRGEGRRARRETAAAGERAERSPDEVVAEADAHGRVVQAVLALDEPYRTVVLLRYFEGLPVADVARRTGAPVETVRTRLRRAHERLRGELGEDPRRPLAVLAGLPLAGGRDVPAGPAAAHRTATPTAAASRAVAAGLGVVAVVGVTAAALWAGRDDDEPARPEPVASDSAARGGRAANAAGETSGSDAGPAPAAGAAVPAPAAGPRGGAASVPQAPGSDPADLVPPPPRRLRDLATGAVLPGVPLDVTCGGATRRVTTAADGSLPVVLERGDDVAVASPEWTLPRRRGGAIRAGDEPGDVWVHRMTSVSGVVRSSDPDTDLRDVIVSVSAGSLGSVQRGDGVPADASWYAMYDVFEPLRRVPVGDRGEFELRVPVVRGARIVAAARGFLPSGTALDFAPGRAARPVEIVLAPAPRVSGRVRRDDGTPLRSVQVRLAVVRSGRAEDFTMADLDVAGGGSAVGGGTVRVHSTTVATTDVRGLFELTLPVAGAATLVVRVPGMRPLRRVLGAVEGDLGGIDLVAAAADGGTVRILRSGAPLADASVLVQDGDRLSPGWLWRTDGEGRARTAWLERGAHYVVSDLGAGTVRVLAWDGAETLDLDALPRDDSKLGCWGDGATLAAPGQDDGGGR